MSMPIHSARPMPEQPSPEPTPETGTDAICEEPVAVDAPDDSRANVMAALNATPSVIEPGATSVEGDVVIRNQDDLNRLASVEEIHATSR